jgi:AcrR family transcriptional regulator
MPPPGPNKHQQRTEATKRKLLRAARRIFARDGFEAASISDIAAEAGHTRGAFYAHFKAKEDLFFALLEEQSSANLEKLRAILEGGPMERRLDFLREFYATRIDDKQWPMLVFEFKLYALRHPRLRAKLAQAHRSIRTNLKLDDVEPLLPWDLRKSPDRHNVKRLTLEVVRTALILEHAYDPAALGEEQVVGILRQLFDAVVDK